MDAHHMIRDAVAATGDNPKVTLEWFKKPDGSRALVFDADAWPPFERVPPRRVRPRTT
jgi:hypothetical protein